MARNRYALRLLVLTGACSLALASPPRLGAQSRARPGIRVLVTTIGSSGGWSGSAFVSIPPSRTTLEDAGGCRTYEGIGRAGSGAVREVHLRFATAPGTDLALELSDTPGCGRGSLELALEDGTRLVPRTGSLTVTALPEDVHGHVSGTIDRDGVPTTVVADFAMRPREGSP